MESHDTLGLIKILANKEKNCDKEQLDQLIKARHSISKIIIKLSAEDPEAPKYQEMLQQFFALNYQIKILLLLI